MKLDSLDLPRKVMFLAFKYRVKTVKNALADIMLTLVVLMVL